jgi:pyruvate formate-lyase activating enzyme-like uncharacterized protein
MITNLCCILNEYSGAAMQAWEFDKKTVLASNKAHFNCSELKFLQANEAADFYQKRQRLLSEIEKNDGTIGCFDTKVDTQALSPGCKLCTQESWSCLFINNICNGNCFYCPTSQTDISQPTTNLLTFAKPQAYVEYLEKSGFKGVSISGGEPLLTFTKTLRFLKAVKSHFGNTIHFWLYTNGILLDKEKLLKLQAAGLDEIRFDIGAVGYDVSKAKLAVKYIKTVTIEIPAVPTAEEKLLRLLPQIKAAGIKYLNLHQLRLTNHNFANLKDRGYTFLHAPKIVVLESELTALKLVKAGLQIGQPVNYCSFVYKNRFQQHADRSRFAQHITASYETITANGYIRRLAFKTEPQNLKRLEQDLSKIPARFWSNRYDTLFLHPKLLASLELGTGDLVLDYYRSVALPQLSYRNVFKQIKLPNSTFVVEKVPVHPTITLKKAEIKEYIKQYLTNTNQAYKLENLKQTTSKWDYIKNFELRAAGFYPYF